MAKYTLLDMVQNVLSSLDSDEVTSITDTTEAMQVAYVIRNACNRISSISDLPEHSSTFNLTATSASTPVLMTRPTAVKTIDWIKYDCHIASDPRPLFRDIKPVSIEQFLAESYALGSDDIAVDSMSITVNGTDTMTVYFTNDAAPKQYTSLLDNQIIFNSYDSAVETYLKGNKSLGFGLLTQQFLLTDNFIPNLDDEQFDLLVNEAKSWAFIELKQTPNMKAEAAAKRGWIHMQRTKEAIPTQTTLEKLPNYGRR